MPAPASEEALRNSLRLVIIFVSPEMYMNFLVQEDSRAVTYASKLTDVKKREVFFAGPFLKSTKQKPLKFEISVAQKFRG